MRAHGDRVVTHLLLHSRILPKKGFPVLFHGIKGTEKRTKRSPSYFNIIEASVVRNYCVMLIEDTECKICKCGASLGFVVILLTCV
jgi:helicase MOV-10